MTRHLVAAMGLPFLSGILLLLLCLGLRPQKPTAVAIGTGWLPSAAATLRQTPLGTSGKVLKKPASRKHGSQRTSSHPTAGREVGSVAPSKSARQIHAAEARSNHVQELGPSLNEYLDDMGLSLAQRRTVSVPVIKRYLGEVEQFASWALQQPEGGALKHLGQPIIDQLLTQYVDRLVAFHMEPHVGRDRIAGQFIALAAHRFLNKQRQKSGLLIDATQQQVNTFIRDFWRRHGLDKIGLPHLYRLRHAGASVGLAQNQVNRNTLQRALRHQAPRSTRRYEKGGRLSQMTAKLPEHVVQNVHARLKAKLAQL